MSSSFSIRLSSVGYIMFILYTVVGIRYSVMCGNYVSHGWLRSNPPSVSVYWCSVVLCVTYRKDVSFLILTDISWNLWEKGGSRNCLKKDNGYHRKDKRERCKIELRLVVTVNEKYWKDLRLSRPTTIPHWSPSFNPTPSHTHGDTWPVGGKIDTWNEPGRPPAKNATKGTKEDWQT